MSECSLFLEYMGDTPRNRVLEYLIESRGVDYSLSDIAEGSNISRTTLFRLWKDIEKLDIVVLRKGIGNIKFYKLNRENIFVIKIIELYDEIIQMQIVKSELK